MRVKPCLVGMRGIFLKVGQSERTLRFLCSPAFPINHLRPAPLFPHQYALGQEGSPWQSSYQISATDHWPLFPSPRNRTHFILSLGKCLPFTGPAGPKASTQCLQRQLPPPPPPSTATWGLCSQAEVREIQKITGPELNPPAFLPGHLN